MEKQLKVYQTVENRGNPEEIKREGPYKGDKKVAWLGMGYYFWESHEANAHWWGKSCYKSKGYIICQASYSLNNCCFDLYDNCEHAKIFKEAIELLTQQGLYKKGKTTVARIIEFLRAIDAFPYNATRVKGEEVRRKNSAFQEGLTFQEGLPAYLDLEPPIQLCFYNKESLNLEEYKIVYPDIYREDYLV